MNFFTKINKVVIPDPHIFLWIASPVAAAAAVNPNGIKTLLNGLTTDRPILCNRVFDNSILVEELFANALRSFETCVLFNKSLCEKLFSSLF